VSTLYQPTPILQFQRLFVRLSPLKHQREGLVGAVLVTNTVSANADCDNGAALRGTRKSRRGDGDADRRLAAYSGVREEAKVGRSGLLLFVPLRYGILIA
jgi:hypothetical protein